MTPRTHRQLTRHARPLFVVVTLVCSLSLAFTPNVPPVTAGDASPEPTATVDPTPTPDPTPDPTADPTPDPTPDPTADTTPTPESTATPDPTPDPTPTPTPDPTSTPDPTAAPEPTMTPPPTPEPTIEPTVEPSPTPGLTPEPTAEPSPSATPSPTPTLPPPGPRALALDATRHQYAAAVDDPAFHLEVFTVETWFLRHAAKPGEPDGLSGIATTTRPPGPDATPDPDADPADGGLASVIPLVTRGDGQDGTGRLDWFVGLDVERAVLVADLQDATDGRSHGIVGSTVIDPETWYHVAASYDGHAWRLYLDGRLEAERTLVDVRPETSGQAPVGLGTALSGDGTTARGAFDGSLDETRIWSVARTGPELRDALHATLAPSTRDLVAAWSMDEGGGTTLMDRTDAHRDARLVGDPGWIDSPIPDDTVPGIPGGLTATGGSGAVAVEWSGVAAADLAGYNLYRATDGPVSSAGEPVNGPRPIGASHYDDTAVTDGTTYTYVVTAVDRYGNESRASAPAAAAPGPTDPGAAPEPVRPPTLVLTTDAPTAGRHRVDPGATVGLTLSLTAGSALDAADLVLTAPAGWTIAGASDDAFIDTASATVHWAVASLPADGGLVRSASLVAPLASPIDGGPSFESTIDAAVADAGGPLAVTTTSVLVAPAVVVEHRVLALVDDATRVATYGPLDDPLTGIGRFETARVRFQIRNANETPVTITPRLEVSPDAAPAYAPVPVSSVDGVPFRMSVEWVTRPAGGTELGPDLNPIPVAAFLVQDRDGLDQVPVEGAHALGVDPLPTLTLPGRSVSEVEFSVRATTDATYGATYRFRLTDDGVPINAAATAVIGLGAKPSFQPLTQFRDGIPVDPPAAAMDTTGGPAVGGTDRPRYALAVARPSTAPSGATGGLGAPLESPHGPYALDSDACAACHSTHTGQGSALLLKAPTTPLCLACHQAGGSAASTDVASQYADPSVPANVPSTRTYYRHDTASAASRHTSASDDEFGGLLERHADCADCHSPHDASATDSVQTSAGWTASGRLGRVSGVEVTNSSTPGGTPTYRYIDGLLSASGQPTRLAFEYQLCFKCHSGYTQLPSNAGFTPSRYLLDKAVEFNPSNASYHPIEAAGTNQSATMAASLAGPSTYKLWNFRTDSTIRCQDCHGDGRALGPSAPTTGTDPTRPGDDLAPHANQPGPASDPVPGILIQSYTYRQLKPPLEAYRPADFALCFVCHAEAPFLDTSGDPRPDTAFRFHGLHTSGIGGKGPSGTNIDAANNGGGLATCAECHFRIHSTTFRVGGQAAYPRLVNFAPNVTDTGSTSQPVGVGAWDQNARTCTLTCHGADHDPDGY